ncbi:hypothetical protein J8M21_15735 [Pseudoalteromonas luteoviolacea]|uniref:leucine-rich repeat domain-containing protein n=1 Tax=Pseudoalteromonas luteoviolacea TaxID=43657 RepID=UPI001B3A4746|nr:hypothetical protein [Pseudoalteromonas luteoviolacea]MBQ4878667.1 hypothetical protein [Pseudoalteromonas luteoviolacea]MBQ4907207.1 hypothetical protein [Pseudoalteromonas luteoviolacea]
MISFRRSNAFFRAFISIVFLLSIAACGGAGEEEGSADPQEGNSGPEAVNPAPQVDIYGVTHIDEQEEFKLTFNANVGADVRITWSYDADIELNISGDDSSTLTVISPDIIESQKVTFLVELLLQDGTSATDEHVVFINARDNVPPEASIQIDETPVERQAFELIGVADDVDGEVVEHLWTHNSALALVLAGENSSTLTVTSPDIQSSHEVLFTYTVTDNQGDSTSVSKLISMEPLTVTFTLAGKVTDAPIAHAKVDFEVGTGLWTAIADENGDYALEIDVDEAYTSELATLKATGVDDQSNVVLVSQLNSVGFIAEQAGADKIVTALELFDVNITNVTTAEYSLLGQDLNGYSNDDELNEAKSRISSQQKLTIAVMLKAIIDHEIQLPEESATTLELVQNFELTEQLITRLQANYPELFTQIESDILNDETLVESTAFLPEGEYILAETQFFDGLNVHLDFNENNTGFLTLSGKRIFFNWQQNGINTRVDLNEELLVKNAGLEQHIGFYTSSFSIKHYERNQQSLAVQVEFDLSQPLDELPSGQYSTVAELFAKDDLQAVTEEMLIGTWSLDFATTNEHFIVDLTFSENGIVEISEGFGTRQVEWRLSQGNIEIDDGLQSFKISLIRAFNLGYQSVVYHGAVYQQGTFVKHQTVNFTDIDYQKTWRKTHSNKSQSAFYVDEHDNFNFKWHRHIQGSNDEGVLKRFEYALNDLKTEYCNVEFIGCEISTTHHFKLLAQVGNTIAVSYHRDKLAVSDKPTEIQFYTLSDHKWQHGEFTQALFSTNKVEQLFSAQTNLYSVRGNEISQLSSQYFCSSNEGCFDSIALNGTVYKSSIENQKLKLEAYPSGEISYMEIINESDNAISMCLYAHESICTNGTRLDFTFIKPELDVVVTQTGQGRLITSTDKFYFREHFAVFIEEVDGYILDSISGCAGELKTVGEHVIYEITNPTTACEIKAEFVPKAMHTQSAVLVDATRSELMDSWFYTIDSDNAGTYYGLDKQVGFNIESLGLSNYQFIFDDYIRTRVNGDDFFAAKFSLEYDVNGTTACWYGAKSDGSVDAIFQFESMVCTAVELASQQPVAEIESSELVGQWYFNFDTSLNWYQLILNADSTGTLTTLNHVGGEEQLYINWAISADDKLEITDETGAFSSLQLIKKTDTVCTFLANELVESNDGQNPSWLRSGTWSFIKQQEQAIGLSDITGMWPVSNHELSAFYLFADGEVRNGLLNGAASAVLDDNTLRVSAGYNSNRGKFEHLCDTTRYECTERVIGEYHIIALNGQTAYIRFVDEINDQHVFKAINIDSSDNVSQGIETHHVSNTTYYEKRAGKVRTWNFLRNWRGELSVTFDGVYPASAVELSQGDLEITIDDEALSYRLIEVSLEGLTLCQLSQGACEQDMQTRLFFQVPHVAVSLDIPEILEPKHNLVSGQLKYGTQLEVKIARPMQGHYADSFSGCGITRPEEISSGYVSFLSDTLTESCSLQMTAAPIPDSNSQRLGIKDKVISHCINKSFNEYVEYQNALFCQRGGLDLGDMTNLEGIEKLTYLTQLNFRGVTISKEGARRLAGLTNLQSISWDTNSSDNTFGDLELDLSQLTNLVTLETKYMPLASITLPNTPTLRKLSLSLTGLAEVDVSGLTGLRYLDVSYSKISSLDLSNNKALYSLNGSSSSLQNITGVTAEHILDSAYLDRTHFETLDLTGFDNLTRLELAVSRLKEIDISKAPRLKSFKADRSQLHTMNFANVSGVTFANLSETPLTELSAEMMPKLQFLDLVKNSLTYLDLSQHQDLQSVSAWQGTLKSVLLPDNEDAFDGNFSLQANKIERLVIPANSNNTRIDVNNNLLTELIVLGTPSSVYAENNLLETVSIHYDSKVTSLSLSGNQLTQADISGEIVNLDLSDNQLTSFSIPEGAQFHNLNLSKNALNRLSGSGKLGSSLDVSNTSLSELDLTPFGAITSLDISLTNIASIDIPATLSGLTARAIPMTELTIPANNNLRYLILESNTLSDLQGLENIDRFLNIYLSDSTIKRQLLDTLMETEKVNLYGLSSIDIK